MSESLNGEAIDRVATLARNTAELQIASVSVSGTGLPSSFPLGFDRRTNGHGLVSLRDQAEKWRIAPERRHGTANVTTLASFMDLTNRHKDEHSAIFAATAWPDPSLTAVIDYHETTGVARFGKHRIHYAFPLTDEFKAWAAQDGKAMVQGEFAAFIEEHAPDLANATEQENKEFGPEGLFLTKIATPTELMMLSRGLSVNVTGKVKNHQSLQTGEGEITFVEEHQDSRGQKLTVPGVFMIAIPAFIGGEAVRIPARLRYRVRDGAVVWFYQMFRWKQLLRDRVVDDLDIAASNTELPTFEGSPEA